jgi:His-Xaa-Ser repeat protein HxsA
VATLPDLLSLGAALLAVLGGAAPSGLLASDAQARVIEATVRRREEEEDSQELLLAAPRAEAHMLLAGHSSHRSHSSHASHASHYSGSGSGYRSGGDYGAPTPAPAYVPPPKPAHVSFVAFPGGRIFVDGKPVGTDATGQLRLAPGTHKVRVENKYLGNTTVDVELAEGQTGPLRVDW